MDAIVNNLIEKVKNKVEQDNLLGAIIRQIVDKAILQLYPYIMGLVVTLCIMILLQGVISYQLITRR